MSGGKYKDCEAHNLKVVGSNPAPATSFYKGLDSFGKYLYFVGAEMVPSLKRNF